jgi:hypothetical protein
MVILAQIGGKDAATVPRLPDPPLFAHYVLENPWPLTIGLALVGIVAMLVLKRRGMPAEGTRALGLAFLLAAIVAGLGAAITTQRETLRSRTRELVDLTAEAKTTDLRDLLTEQARVGAFMVHFGGVRGREEVLGAVRRYLGEQIPLESHEIGPVQATIDGPNIARTQVRVWVKPRKDEQKYGVATGAWFRIEWRRDGAGPWRASTISIMQIDGAGVNTDSP